MAKVDKTIWAVSLKGPQPLKAVAETPRFWTFVGTSGPYKTLKNEGHYFESWEPCYTTCMEWALAKVDEANRLKKRADDTLFMMERLAKPEGA